MQQIEQIDYGILPDIINIYLELDDKNKANIKINETIYFTCDYYQFLFSSSEKTYYYYQNKDSILNEVKQIKRHILSHNKSYKLIISDKLNSLLLNLEHSDK